MPNFYFVFHNSYILLFFLISGCVFAHSDHVFYESPFTTRYRGDGEMSFIFSQQNRFATWRRVWIALAKAQKDVGIAAITHKQIAELERFQNDINFERAEKLEQELHHDVMAHIHAYGEQCPLAKPIIHLGATSCLVTDNADVLIMRSAADLIRKKLERIIKLLACKAMDYRNIPCLSYTHLQPAQPTTVGKRMTMWLQDLVMDCEDLDHARALLALLGAKGATGTQASFLQLCNSDHAAVIDLEKRFVQYLGGDHIFPIAGQTYTRKQDVRMISALSHIAVSATKMATDMRLLSHMQEFSEPHESKQVGSSAMPYKKNPILCERVCAFSRLLITMSANAPLTAATQWLERTLDDSANRRVVIAESFLLTDAILDLVLNIVEGMSIYPEIIQRNLERELPFFATEALLMAAVQKGGDRQTVHECIRKHTKIVSDQIKQGGENDLLDRLANDPGMALSQSEIEQIIHKTCFVGRAPEQVIEFVKEIRLD